MSQQIQYLFDNAADYTFPASTIEWIANQLQLKLVDNPGQDFVRNFDSDTDDIYDPSLLEYISGKIQQKDQRPENSIIGATFNNGFDASFSADGASRLAVINGTPTLVGGKLVCIGAHGIYYEDAQIGALSGNFVVKFKYTPDYTGGPSQNVDLITIARNSGTTDRIQIFNSPSGNNLRITANGLAAVQFGVWSAVQDQEYTFEVHCINNVVSIYVDGIQIGTGKEITPAQGTIANRIWIGASVWGYGVAEGSFDDFIMYSTAAQSTSYEVPEYAFLEASVVLREMEYTGPGTLISFDLLTLAITGLVKATLQIGRSGNFLYWGGSSWVTSNNSYDQASDENDFNINAAALAVNGEIYGQFQLHFPNSHTQNSIDTLTASLTAQVYDTNNPKAVANTTFRSDQILGLLIGIVAAGGDTVKMNLIKDGTPIWYNDGTGLIEDSDDTYAQSNTAAELIAQLPIIPGSDYTWGVQWYLHSNDGSSTPELQSCTIDYDIAGPEKETVHLTEMWFDSNQIDGDIESKVIEVKFPNKDVIYKGSVLVLQDPQEMTPDPKGRYKVKLMDTVNMTLRPGDEEQYYEFYIDDELIFKFNVPEDDESNIFDNLV